MIWSLRGEFNGITDVIKQRLAQAGGVAPEPIQFVTLINFDGQAFGPGVCVLQGLNLIKDCIQVVTRAEIKRWRSNIFANNHQIKTVTFNS